MTQPWAADPRLTFKVVSMKHKTAPSPPGLQSIPEASESPQEARRGMQTGLTSERRKHMTLQGFPCHHIRKKKKTCDRSNFIHVIWFTESKSEFGQEDNTGEGPLGTETQTACVYRGAGVTLFDKGVM